ncbi:stalk domain-containing protein [Bacillus sp. FJAT-45350]|uniref:stalk domain-containing protein n=1 Tax=Bacillus sp. FJAT-45350 TaxID=2011014 RepID=UPI000BB780E0|nr:copper amine oxidase N-terminal domain-containing protein [Bacillus sp. FJAT-45350]
MKKLCFLLLVLLLASLSYPLDSTQANNNPRIILDGIELQTQAVLHNGSTLVPIRAVSESLGAKVNWNNSSRTVTIIQDNKTISFVVGSTIANVNGTQITIPPAMIMNGSTMVPLRFISETLGLTVDWNGATRTVTLSSTDHKVQSTAPPHTAVANATTTVYTVVAGDTLFNIANRFGTTVTELKNGNNLSTDTLHIGQRLHIHSGNSTLAQDTTSTASNSSVTVTYIDHTIRSGDTIWNLSTQYGVPFNELLKENNLTTRSTLKIGQTVRIPEYHIPTKPVVSDKHGEVLDWWTEARYVFSTGKTATITDFQTGRTFQVRHTMGGNHADSEPLTAQDAQTMREIWGGQYSWTPRAIIVEVDGRKLAAAMHSMPHGDHVIKNNNYNGHFCIHFFNSTRHKDGLVQDSMHKQIEIAAGRSIK